MPLDSDDLSGYVVFASTARPEVTLVRLYNETIGHIEERHPEVLVIAGTDGIAEVIHRPSRVLLGSPDPENAFVFVSDNVTFGGASLYVPVKTVEGTSARVRTAYFRSDASLSQVLWEQKNVT